MKINAQDQLWLEKHGACAEVVQFVVDYGSLAAAWPITTNALWMLWVLRRLERPEGENRRVLAALLAWGKEYFLAAHAAAAAYADTNGNGNANAYAYVYVYANAYADVHSDAYADILAQMADVIRATVPNPWA